MNQITKLVISLAIVLAAAVIGGLATAGAVQEWYPTLAKPSFNPPAWIFGPVWTILYLMMGVALFLVWRKGASGNPEVRTALFIFGLQLFLNVLWSILFFGLQSPLAGFIDIVLLWVAILVTVILFRRISGTAALLLIPYLLWVSFALALNFSIWRLNP